MEFDAINSAAAALSDAARGPAFVKLPDTRVIMSEITTTTSRPIKYWNGKITKRWNRRLPLRMTAEQIDAMLQTWPEFAISKQNLERRWGNCKTFEPWIYSHGAVIWLATASA